MRIATLGFLAVLSAAPLSTAMAADLDYGYLRGSDDEYTAPAPLIDWSGVYVGGHGGYSTSALGYNRVFQPILADHFRATVIEQEFGVSNLLSMPSRRAHGRTFGGYGGYNVQFEDVVVGVEVDYTSFNKAGISYNSIGRVMTTSGNLYETVDLSGLSSTKIEDYGTIRGRVGYAFGNFLPFVTGGVAVGRATIEDQAHVQSYGYNAATYAANQALTSGNPAQVAHHGYASFNQNYPEPYSSPDGEVQTRPAAPIALPSKPKSKAMGGIALGAGLEFAITSNIILRGEYQYVLFDDFDGHKANINTVRGGAAIKF